MTEKHFVPLITIPTRIAKTSKTLIDNIFTNRHVEDTVSGNLTVGISDHMPQFCIILNTHSNNNQPKQKQIRFKRDFRKFDHEKLYEN